MYEQLELNRHDVGMNFQTLSDERHTVFVNYVMKPPESYGTLTISYLSRGVPSVVYTPGLTSKLSQQK